MGQTPKSEDVLVGAQWFDAMVFDQVAASPVEERALVVAADLIARGWTPRNPVYWDDCAIALVAKGPGEVPRGRLAALICWRMVAIDHAAFVSLGWTDPDFRRRGLYRALFLNWVGRLARRDPRLREVQGGHHVDNLASAAMAQALGRRVTHAMTSFDVAALREGTDQ